MSEPSTYTPRPQPTLTDIQALALFITSRVTPLRDKAKYGSEEMRAFQALLDTVSVVSGAAGASAKRGDYLGLEYLHLTTIARHWNSHPDFKDSWR